MDERGWLTKDQMREAIAICQSLPGPLAIQVEICRLAPDLRRVLGLQTVPGNLIDKERDQRFGQKVAHPGNDAQARAGDVGGRVLASRQGDQRIVGAVQDKGRRECPEA